MLILRPGFTVRHVGAEFKEECEENEHDGVPMADVSKDTTMSNSCSAQVNGPLRALTQCFSFVGWGRAPPLRPPLSLGAPLRPGAVGLS